jgi:signal peptidase I
VLIIIAAPTIALLLIFFVFQSYQVDGPSMEPSLQNNDRLIVWKLAQTWSKITGHPYIPDRGDIVIFREPVLQNKQLIKRVIGIPGDHVVINSNKITIYNKFNPNGFNPDLTLPYGRNIGNTLTDRDVDIVINPGELFVCGDNRPNSLDSRYFGVVYTKDVIGKLLLRIVPLNKAERF